MRSCQTSADNHGDLNCIRTLVIKDTFQLQQRNVQAKQTNDVGMAMAPYPSRLFYRVAIGMQLDPSPLSVLLTKVLQAYTVSSC